MRERISKNSFTTWLDYGLAQLGMVFVDIPFLPSVILGFISLYLLVVEMRVLGLLFRSYRQRLGWLG